MTTRLPFSALLCVVATGCADPSEAGPADGAGSSGLSAELVLSDIMPTVAELHWEAAGALEPSVALYLVGESEPVGSWDSGVAGSSGTATIVGLKSNATYEVVVSGVLDGVEVSSPSAEVSTGFLDPALPLTEVTVDTGDGVGGHTLFSVVRAEGELGGDAAAMMLDLDGDVVWHRVFEGQNMVTSAALDLESDSVLALTSEGLVRAPLDGGELQTTPLQDHHHDFTLVPDGTVAVLVEDIFNADDKSLVVDGILEIAPDGAESMVWRSGEHLEELGISDEIVESASPGRELTHANAIDYVEEMDAYLVSMANLPGVALVGRQSGGVLWSLRTTGGGSLELVADEAYLVLHAAQLHDDGRLWLFVNMDTAGPCSRIVELDIDLLSGTATEVSSITPTFSDCQTVFALGDVEELDQGHLAVTWGTAGVVEELDASGEPVLQVQSEFGYAFGYGERVEPLHVLW